MRPSMGLLPWLLSALVLIAQAGLLRHELRHAFTVAEAAVSTVPPDAEEHEDSARLCDQCLASAGLHSPLIDGTAAAPAQRHAPLHGGLIEALPLGTVDRWHQARDPPAA